MPAKGKSSTRLKLLTARILLGSALLIPLTGATCFTAKTPERSYFVLHSKTSLNYKSRPIQGLVRVKTLHADAVYEKYQIAVRRNPYELQYDEYHVWVAKPKQMISDLIAKSIKESNRFTGVTRELGEVRPNFNLSGDLHAIEVYDSGDQWFAHLSVSMQLSAYSTGEIFYYMKYDERRLIPKRSFSLAARALSELLAEAVEKMLKDLEEVEKLKPLLPEPAATEHKGGANAKPASDGDTDPKETKSQATDGDDTRDDATQDASTQDASTQEDTAQDNTAQDDLPQDDTAQDDTAQDDTTQDDTAMEDKIIMVPEKSR